MKTKGTAAILALLLGGLGVHKFYLGQNVQGFLYLLCCWTLIPSLIAFLEFFVYLFMNENEFNLRYNSHMLIPQAAGPQMGQNVTINLGTEQLQALRPASSPTNIADDLKKLQELHVAGVLTEEEFAIQKQRLLS